MRGARLFPNLPGHYESGRFRLGFGRVRGRQQINLIFDNDCVASFHPGELADLQQILQSMEMFLTGESIASLPPDDDHSMAERR